MQYELYTLAFPFDLRYECVTYIYICDWACENQPCERKLHRVIFSLISSALIEVFCFREVQREVHEFRFVIIDSL